MLTSDGTITVLSKRYLGEKIRIYFINEKRQYGTHRRMSKGQYARRMSKRFANACRTIEYTSSNFLKHEFSTFVCVAVGEFLGGSWVISVHLYSICPTTCNAVKAVRRWRTGHGIKVHSRVELRRSEGVGPFNVIRTQSSGVDSPHRGPQAIDRSAVKLAAACCQIYKSQI